ncbi:MAG: lipase, partial [Marmoricola sp.]|nr:lipase [Marmoricola sp.]
MFEPQHQTDPGPRVRPRDDPFHDAPEGLADLAPGTLVRSRTVRLAFLGAVPQSRMRAWQLAYRSTDLHGRPELAVTTVVVPELRDGEVPRGLVAYQCAIDAVSDKCFPSYALRVGPLTLGALPPFELSFIADLLERGFAV